jgi:hypothetical protein
MCAKASRVLRVVSVVAVGGLHFSCSTNTAPQPGTPAFYWSAAKETFAANDYVKTSQNLDGLMIGENEYTARVQPWLLILTSGLARGYMEAADSLEAGVRAKKADPGGFRKYISNYRSTAGRLSLHFAETFIRFQKGKDDPVLLAFSYPGGSAAPVPELTRAKQGLPLRPAEIDAAEKHAIDRAVLLETCRAVGAPDDTAKALDLFKSGSVQVSRATFLAAMGDSLYEQAQLYGPSKLDDPSKIKIFYNLASDALKTVPETKQTKELSAKIQKAMKK